MTDEESEFEALKAEIKRHDTDPEDLAVVPRDDLEDLRDTNDEQAEEIDGLEDEVASLEDEVDELEDEVEEIKNAYVDDLSEVMGLSEDLLKERFDVGELREMHAEKAEEGEVDELGSMPDPKSGDPEPGETPSAEDQEEIEDLREKKEFYERKSGILAEKELERVEERLAELTGE